MIDLPLLSRTTPGAPQRRPVSILQIGGGNFLRGFFDWMIDVAHEKGLFAGGIAIAQTKGHGLAEALAAQDGLYTVLTRGVLDGREICDRRIIGSLSDAFDTATRWDLALAYASDPQLQVIVSNTTESGIVDRCEPPPGTSAPASFPAKLTTLLQARFHALGDKAGSGLLVLPCELIESNGATLRRIVSAHGRRWHVGDGFEEWLGREVHFLDTLVDRIVPGHPGHEIERLEARWGSRDPLAVVAEPFHLLVVEAAAGLEARLPLRAAGLNVVWTDRLERYRVRKIRILNGAHTAVGLPALLAGLDTVLAIMRDPLFASFLGRILDDEIAPFVPIAEAECRAYAASVLERFANPHVRHELTSIALNSTAKWRVRILPSIKDALAARGSVPNGLAFSLAALLRLARGHAVGGILTGEGEGGPYSFRDDAEALAAINAAWSRFREDLAEVVREILGAHAIWGEDLNRITGLAERTSLHLARIESAGVRAALAAVLS